jgi:hypothetical protein
MHKGDDSGVAGMSHSPLLSELKIMTITNQNRLSRRQVLALRGLRFPTATLKLLRAAGIYCDPAVSIEYQHLAKRYVIWGRESGGAVMELGAYCGFVDVTGEHLEWLTRLDAVGRNGIHAAVVAPSLVRIQVFRSSQTFEVLISRHELKSKAAGMRPTLENKILFHGLEGTLPLRSWGDWMHEQVDVLPVFCTRSGEQLAIPEVFRDGVALTISGARCCGCHHCHVTKPGTERTAISIVEGRL